MVALIGAGALVLAALGGAAWRAYGPPGGSAGAVAAGALPAGALAALSTRDAHSVALSAADADTAYFGHHDGVMRSTDAGRTWERAPAGAGFDAMALAAPAGGRLYAAGHDVLAASDDGGATWQTLQSNLPGTDIHAFAAAPDEPRRVHASVVGHGIWSSDDGGHTWRRLPGSAPGDIVALASAGGEPETLYAASAGAGLLRSADGGRTWAPLGGRGAGACPPSPSTRRRPARCTPAPRAACRRARMGARPGSAWRSRLRRRSRSPRARRGHSA